MYKYKLIVLIVVLFLVPSISILKAQNIKRTSVIPYSKTPQLESIISFGGENMIPKQAIAQSDGDVKLKLTVHSNFLDGNTCNVYIKDKEKQLGFLSLSARDTVGKVVFIDLNEEEFNLVSRIKEGNKLDLELDFKNGCEKGKSKAISFVMSNDNINVNEEPRLIIDYKMEYPRNGLNWSQSYGDAQHTNSCNWNLDYDAKSNLEKKKDYTWAPKDNALIEEYISIFNTNPISFSKNYSDSTIVKLWPSNATWNSTVKQAWQPIWESSIGLTNPKQQPLITPDGKMLYFSGVQKYEELAVLDLYKEGALVAQKDMGSIKLGANINLSQTTNTITMGYDGSLYVPTYNGIVAIGPYPNLQPKWVYKMPSNFGPISVDQHEHVACFIQVDQNKAGKLVLVDNQNGEILATTKDVLGKYTNNNKEFNIPPVVIQNINENIFHVLVPNKNEGANTISIFEVNYNRAKNREKASANIILVKKIEQEKNTEGLGFAQIMISNSNAYIFDQDSCKLTIYSPNGDISSSKLEGCIDNKPFYFGTFKNKIYQANVRDYDSYEYSNDKNSLFDILNINKKFDKSFYSPDGSFYSISEGYLYRFYPTEIKGDNSLNLRLEDIGNQVTHGHNKEITIAKQTINNTQSAIFYSPRITFQPGVVIQKGAVLSFKTLSN